MTETTPVAAPVQASALTARLVAGLDLGELTSLYCDLHQHPELSFHEGRTAGIFASRLQRAGATVTTGVGRTGVVGLLENGVGPTVLVRADMDGLPIEERTGLEYASRAVGTTPPAPRPPSCMPAATTYTSAPWSARWTSWRRTATPGRAR